MKEENKETVNDQELEQIINAFTGKKEEISHDELRDILALTGEDNVTQSALVNSEDILYERLPMLDVVLDRFARILSTSFKNFVSDKVDIACEQKKTMRYGDALNTIPLPGLICIFESEELNSKGILFFSSKMIFSLVDVLLGGKTTSGERERQMSSKTYTPIEKTLVERVIGIILSDLHKAFAPLCNVTFMLDRMETTPRFATITQSDSASILVNIQLSVEERGGSIFLILPYVMLEPIRDLLLQGFMGEKFGNDPLWEKHLSKELLSTYVDLKATLPSEKFQLSDVLSWKKGTKILLHSKPTTKISLQSGELPLFKGNMGQKNGKVSIKIDDILFSKDSKGENV